MNGARPAPAGRRAWGRSARSGWCPTRRRSACCRTRRTPGAMLVDHLGARRRGRAGLPARVPQAHGRRGSPSAARVLRGRVRERVRARRAATTARYVPVDSSLCFSTIGMTASQDYVDALVDALEAQGIPLEQYYAELGHGQQEISTAHAPGAAGGRRAAARARDDPRRRGRARARRVARAEAVARGRGQRLPHPLLAVGHRRRAQPLPRPGRRPTGSPPRAARSSPACSPTCPGCAA